MKKRKTVQKTMCLDVVVNLRNRLFKKQQEATKYKTLYIDKAVECTNLEQRLKIEEHHTGFYSDCTEYLNFALAKAQNSTKADIEASLQKYNDFRQERYKAFMAKQYKAIICLRPIAARRWPGNNWSLPLFMTQLINKKYEQRND